MALFVFFCFLIGWLVGIVLLMAQSSPVGTNLRENSLQKVHSAEQQERRYFEECR